MLGLFGDTKGKSKARDSQPSATSFEYDYLLALEDIRLSYRRNRREPLMKDRLNFPDWMFHDEEPMKLNIQEQETLISKGEIVWASCIQANSLLFGKGGHNHPASIIYSVDARSFAAPQFMLEVASGLFDIKGSETNSTELQRFADVLQDELERMFAYPIPLELTYDIPCLYNSMLFERRHLPMRYLTGGLFPVFTHTDCQTVIMVPYYYWPQSFIDNFWKHA